MTLDDSGISLLKYLPMEGPRPDTLVFARCWQDYDRWAVAQGLVRRTMNEGRYPDGGKVRWITSHVELLGWDKVRIVYLPRWHAYFPGLMHGLQDGITRLRAAGQVVSEEQGVI